MSHPTIGRATGRGPSFRPALSRRAARPPAPRAIARPGRTQSAAVRRARRRLLDGFYDHPEVISVALDRLIDDARARFGRDRD